MKASSQKNIAVILFLTAIIALLVSGFIGYAKYTKVFRLNEKIITSYKTIRAANQSLISINEAALKVSTLLYTRDLACIKNLKQVIISAQVNLANLSHLTQDNLAQKQITQQLNSYADKKISFLSKIVARYSVGDIHAALQIASDKNRLHQSDIIIQLIIDIKKLETDQLEKLAQESRLDKVRADNFYVFAGIVDVLLFLLSFLLARKFLGNDL